MTAGGRLLIRLTTECNSGCAHCTIADIAHHPDKATEDAWSEILQARQRGCTELVFMRGEPTLRKDLITLTRRARRAGYQHVQVQTNGRMLSYPRYAKKLVAAGVNFFEVSFFGPNAALHDLIDGNPGSFDQASEGLRNMLATGAGVLVTIPIVRRNVWSLNEIVRTLHALGVRRVQFNFSRPVQIENAWNTTPLVRLSEASPSIRAAMRLADSLGMATDTEAIPLCHLDPAFRGGAEVHEDFGRHQVEDVHRSESSRSAYRAVCRPRAAACEGCALVARCPTTWAAYQALYGTWEFRPVAE